MADLIITVSNPYTKEYFFVDKHSIGGMGKSWTPVSYQLPYRSGNKIIRTKLEFVENSSYKLIETPKKYYE